VGGIILTDVTVLLCSHRAGGTGSKFIELLNKYVDSNIEVISFCNINLEACVQCLRCGIAGRCVKFTGDDFNETLNKLKESKTILFISPLYALIPSKLAAFLDRLTSLTYFTEQHSTDKIPLLGKKCGVICYDSYGRNKILEGVLKNVIKPNIIGFNDRDKLIDFNYIGEDDGAEEKNIVEYLDYYLNKYQNDIFR
jgi:hypothetical protein